MPNTNTARYCLHCHKKLRAFRVANDWTDRQYHKSCYRIVVNMPSVAEQAQHEVQQEIKQRETERRIKQLQTLEKKRELTKLENHELSCLLFGEPFEL